jgi:hypothetical protein
LAIFRGARRAGRARDPTGSPCFCSIDGGMGFLSG